MRSWDLIVRGARPLLDILDAHNAGRSLPELAAEAGCTRQTIANMIDRLGIPRQWRTRKTIVRSGDPNVIGEHEVPAVHCPHCRRALPWALIKGWR